MLVCRAVISRSLPPSATVCHVLPLPAAASHPRELTSQPPSKLVDLVGAIRVVCRVRPPAAFDPDESGEDGTNYFSTIAFGDKSGGSTFAPNGSGGPNGSTSSGSDAMLGASSGPSNLFENELVLRDAGGRTRGQYEFEACFSPASSQRDVFRYVEPLLGSVIDGYNLVLIAYGRTGAGKTFTMTGTHAIFQIYNTACSPTPTPNLNPVLPRTLDPNLLDSKILTLAVAANPDPEPENYPCPSIRHKGGAGHMPSRTRPPLPRAQGHSSRGDTCIGDGDIQRHIQVFAHWQVRARDTLLAEHGGGRRAETGAGTAGLRGGRNRTFY